MLHGARFLLAAFSRLARALLGLALMTSLCSPTSSSSPTVVGPAAAAAPWQQKQVRPPAAAGKKQKHQHQQAHQHHHPPASGEADKGGGHHLMLVAPPPPAVPPALVVSNREEEREVKTAAATRRGVRPPRLVIPLPRADPFGGAADRETDAAAEVEVRGDGFCLASRRGVRHAMEDGYGVITAAADDIIGGASQLAFYGVYDGHGGRAAVDFVADKLGKNVVAAATAAASSRRQGEEEEEQDDDEVMAAIRSAYLTTDRELLSQGVRGGACAATALVKDGELYVANVGDCRAVLCSGHGGVATALTSDHTAGREDERRRIESSGGYVSCGSTGVWRVQDSLAVTRAFGDASMKPWVTGEPEVWRRHLTPDCRFLVLATDGLWNKVTCQEAVDAVVAAAGTAAAAVGPCKDLVAMARSMGSRDDITVMVVDLQRFVVR